MDNPELYNKYNQVQQHGVEKFFEFFGEHLRDKFCDRKIELLDVGSGCGRILTEVVINKSGLKFSKVIGVDVSQEMLRFSQQKYGSDLVSFQFMDAGKEIPESLKNRQFDMVTSFFCLHWIKDLNAAFANIHDLLKSNGMFCCIFPQLPKSSNRKDTNDKDSKYLINTRDDLSSLRLLEDPIDVVKSLVTENGMQMIEFIDIQDDEFEFENKESFTRLMESTVPSALSEKQKQDIVEKQLKLIPLTERNGKFSVNFRNLYFIVRKI